MKTISLKIPEELYHILDQLSAKRGQNMSSLIRDTLQEYLLANNSAHTPSFYTRALDLIGTIEGPEDLSSNKDHMQGYGE